MRLYDPLSGERISISWQDFYNHRGKKTSENVFALQEVKDLIAFIRRRRPRIDASQYLRDEITYIQSAYRSREKDLYFEQPRFGRGIPLGREQREACWTVLEGWREWLGTGDMCDVDGFTLETALLFESEVSLQRIGQEFPIVHVLADEYAGFLHTGT